MYSKNSNKNHKKINSNKTRRKMHKKKSSNNSEIAKNSLLKKNYLEFIENMKSIQLNDKTKQSLRIVTYNVHYFTDIYEKKSTYDAFFDDLHAMDADIVALQECIYGSVIKITDNIKIDMNTFHKRIAKLGYKKFIMCNTVPSWYSSVYGNVLLIKKTLYNQDNANDLNETIYTFPKSQAVTTVSGKHTGIPETRCFMKIHFSYNDHQYVLYNTHLDVANEDVRLNQMKIIVRDIRKHYKNGEIVLIVGDFNTTYRDITENDLRTKKYIKHRGKVMDYLGKNRFYDMHENSKHHMTTWNDTKADFIYCNVQTIPDSTVEPGFFYTANSDHLPVTLTITPQEKKRS